MIKMLKKINESIQLFDFDSIFSLMLFRTFLKPWSPFETIIEYSWFFTGDTLELLQMFQKAIQEPFIFLKFLEIEKLVLNKIVEAYLKELPNRQRYLMIPFVQKIMNFKVRVIRNADENFLLKLGVFQTFDSFLYFECLMII
jgi:hypothetical protein